ncbi:MAG TPA: galactose-1-phosphate uridylyltransferase [Microbacteriaceae bacterium]
MSILNSGNAVTMNNNPLRAKLSDGREILYFYDEDTTITSLPKEDSRKASERQSTPRLRLDYLSGEWVSIATDRNQRAHLPAKNVCPLCVQSEENQSEIPGDFDVVVFENKNPSFGPGLDEIATAEITHLGHEVSASGRCEVVVFSPNHEGSLAQLGERRIRTLVRAWAHRTKELMDLESVQTVFPFENRGEEIGVTLHHPHGQIYGYPFVPAKLRQMLQMSKMSGAGFFDEVIRFEENSPRLLLSNEDFIAFVPFAARWPIEINIMSRRASDLTELTENEISSFSKIYTRLLTALDSLFEEKLPYISSVYQKPKGEEKTDFRLHLRITSPRRAKNKLKFLAGSESGMGAFVSDLSPEEVASAIRELL